MSEPEMAPVSLPLTDARQHLRSAQLIGQPGFPSMAEGANLQHQHAEMAQTAALVSIAESLDRIRGDGSGNGHKLSLIASALTTVAKEITKVRQGRR